MSRPTSHRSSQDDVQMDVLGEQRRRPGSQQPNLVSSERTGSGRIASPGRLGSPGRPSSSRPNSMSPERPGSGWTNSMPHERIRSRHTDAEALEWYSQNIRLPRLQGGVHFQINSRGPTTLPRRSFYARRQDIINNLPSRHIGDMPGEAMTTVPLLTANGQVSQEHHAAQIVSEMEKDTALMEDNPLSEQLRMETLREMPESLTMKRTIKKKLVKSVSQKSKRSPLSIWKRLKYRVSMSFTKLNLAVKNVIYTLELWYSSLRQIEGHFGSGVATYFSFLRWLFLLNSFVFLISFGFVVLPQLLHRFYEPVDSNRNVTETRTDYIEGMIQLKESANSTHLVTPLPVTEPGLVPRARSRPYASNEDFSIGDIFTGEGFLTDTTLYYGYYSNGSLSLVPGLQYRMSPAYFFTTLLSYLFIFITLSVSMARSYRRTFIETAGDLKNVFAHKVFCSWDFSIATGEAAELKSKSIFNELKELLEDMRKDDDERDCGEKCTLFTVRMFLNVFVAVTLIGTGILMWFLLTEEIGGNGSGTTLVMPLIITVVMMIAPILFSRLTRHEQFTNPRTALFVTLIRTFLMEIVIVGVVVGFWLSKKKNTECWETSLGQEVYRLVMIDFLLAVVGTSVAEFIRFRIYKSVSEKIGAPEFDIARNTLNLIYNQTLFFVGFYFSPLLAFIMVIKMFITFHIKKCGLLTNCQPSARPWRAAQTQTLFLVLSFIASLMVLILLGYVIVQVNNSKCGPFQAYSYPYEMILDIFQVRRENDFLAVVRFLVKPGVTAGVLLAMCVGVYYLRAKSHAHRRMVDILREMLVMEAKDKEFLLRSISRVTEGQWMYNLNARQQIDSTSSSAASSTGVSSVSEAFSHGDGGRLRAGYRHLQNRQHPSSSSDVSVQPSDYDSEHRHRSGRF